MCLLKPLNQHLNADVFDIGDVQIEKITFEYFFLDNCCL